MRSCKRRESLGSALLALLALTPLAIAAGPAGETERAPASAPRDAAKTLASAPRLAPAWTRKLDGWASDLAVSADGQAVLVATIPNQDEGTRGPFRYGVARFSRGGKLEWRVPTPTPLKSLAISDDGALAVLANYENRIVAVDRRGKTRWEIDGICHPILLSRRQLILCYHDDDLEPEVAFDAFAWSGKKLGAFPIPKDSDILALKVSADERNLALALTGGWVLRVDISDPAHPKTLWKAKAASEVVDVAIASGEVPRVAALREEGGGSKEATEKPRGLDWFDAQGKPQGSSTLPKSSAEEVELAADGSLAWVYGNEAAGQLLAALPAPGGAHKVEGAEWKLADGLATEFSFPLVPLGDRSVVGALEGDFPGQSARTQFVARIGEDGAVRWYAPLAAELVELPARVYLFAYTGAPELVATATDNGILSVFTPGQAAPKGATGKRARKRKHSSNT